MFSLGLLSYGDGDPLKQHLNLRGKHLLCHFVLFVLVLYLFEVWHYQEHDNVTRHLIHLPQAKQTPWILLNFFQ